MRLRAIAYTRLGAVDRRKGLRGPDRLPASPAWRSLPEARPHSSRQPRSGRVLPGGRGRGCATRGLGRAHGARPASPANWEAIAQARRGRLRPLPCAPPWIASSGSAVSAHRRAWPGIADAGEPQGASHRRLPQAIHGGLRCRVQSLEQDRTALVLVFHRDGAMRFQVVGKAQRHHAGGRIRGG